MATFSFQILFLLHREARPEGHSLIFSLKDTPPRQMLTSTTRVFKQPSKNWRTVFSVYYPAAHEAHVSHTGCTGYNHCTWFHMQVFLPDSQWAVTANYHSAAYPLKVGCLGLAFPGKVRMSICEKTLAGLEELLDSCRSKSWAWSEGGRAGLKWGEGTRWMDARVDFSVRSQKLLIVRALGSLQFVIALYPPLQFYFPVASICQKGLCVCQDFPS